MDAVCGCDLQCPVRGHRRRQESARARCSGDRGLATIGCDRRVRRGVLRAGTRHEAANLCVAVAVVVGPHDGRTETVGLGYNGYVRYDKPLPINSYPKVPILGVPVDILHTEAVSKRAAEASSACETVEPRLER